MKARITVHEEHWPIHGSFTISRGSKTVADVIVAEVSDPAPSVPTGSPAEAAAAVVGHGECVPYAHYGETMAQTLADMRRVIPALEADPSRETLARLLPASAARNALDCALWDWEAKKAGRSVRELAGLAGDSRPMQTCFTLSLAPADVMAARARENAWRPMLKLKVGGPGDVEKVAAVRAAAPNCRLVVDANEGWSPDSLRELVPRLAELGVELVEQPLPAGSDLGPLAAFAAGRPAGVVLCADESCRADVALLDEQAKCYQAVNIKLDKTGGLTHAIALARRARELGMKIMVGCMVSTSLSMAPALLLASAFGAEWVDLDGPLLLEKDRQPGLRYEGSTVFPSTSELWG